MLKRTLKILAVFVAAVFLAVAGFYIYLANQTGKRAQELKLEGLDFSGPILFAHRGGRHEAPENTIQAFENAAEGGVDVLELDVRVTKDGELVVIHDANLERTTNGTGSVAEKSLNELKSLDAAFFFKGDGNDSFAFRGKGIEIPTLEEVFDRFPDRAINIELKNADPALARPLCSLIKKYERTNTVIVASTATPVIQEFRSSCAGVATSASFREALWFLFLFKIGLSDRFEADMQALQIPENLFGSRVVTKEFVEAAHERGLKLHIWTINKKSDIKRLFDAGVDGVMTDRPSLRVGL